MEIEEYTHCMGVGPSCTHCGLVLPNRDNAPRKCPELNEDVSRKEVKENVPKEIEKQECARDGCERGVDRLLSRYCSEKCERIAFENAASKLRKEGILND